MTTILLIFTIAASVQLFFWAFFFGAFAFGKIYQKASNLIDISSVSLIICARNEEANLRKNLSIILQQDYPLFEVIVVDDASEDESATVLAEYASKYPNFRFIKMPQKENPGKKTALIHGIAEAKSEWILLCDADCRPVHLEWIKSMMESRLSENTEIVLGYAPYDKHAGILNKWIRFETVYTALQYLSAAFWKIPYMGVGRNLLYKKSIFEKNKAQLLNNIDIASGDDDLFINAAANASNTVFCINPKSFVLSEPKKTAKALYTQKSRHFTSSVRYKFAHKFMLGFLNLSHIIFWLFILPVFLFFPLPAFVLLTLRTFFFIVVWWKLYEIFNEKDLKFYTFAFDPLLLLYYIIFIPALSVKNRKWK